jgi:hypothetical protein
MNNVNIGVTLDKRGDVITITEVYESGGCALWNAANNSTFEIKHGDRIIEAGGSRAAEDILEHLQTHAPPFQFIICRPNQFQVAWIKSTVSDKLGLALAKSGESGLMVKAIDPGMASHNANNPSNTICEGDRIIAVNGVSGGYRDLIAALADQCGWTFDVQRHAVATQGGYSLHA